MPLPHTNTRRRPRISVRERLKANLSWILANGQTIRWATEQVVLRDLMQRFPPATNASSADIGCGGGRYILDLLIPVSERVIGVELNPESVAIAANRFALDPRARFAAVVYGDADRIPLLDRSMDYLLCTQVLEHLADIQKGVRELHRILRPGGTGIFSIPIPPDPYPNPEHPHKTFTPLALDGLLSAAGFTIVERRECMYFVSRAILWLVAATRLPFPLVPLCRLEQIMSRYVRLPRPYAYVCVVSKQ